MSSWDEIKSILKSAFPFGVASYIKLKEFYRSFTLGDRHMRRVFSDIYKSGGWGECESLSGPGSTLKGTEVVRRELPLLLEQLRAKSLLDAPCGEFKWLNEVRLSLDRYVGADVVPELI